jgi:predicted DsbA family dithiol-disulfide isomerase
MAQKQLVVDVISDVICPWCFLGKRRLDKAVAMVPDVDVTVRWRPFFLDPSIPAAGLDRREYMLKKFGEERLKTIHDPLKAAGEADGVPYNFDAIKRTPNTLNAHRVIRWAGATGRQQHLVEAMFMAYWSEGQDLGNAAVLTKLAQGSGMDGAQVARALASDEGKLDVVQEVQQAQTMGVQGVPTFIMAQRFGVSGAQSAEFLADGIRRAVEKQV